jgi:uncharacterized protein (TIGR03437 family)
MRLRFATPRFPLFLLTALFLPVLSWAALSITSPVPLPQATVGTFYTQQLTVSGGKGPYVWAEAFTPSGLTLSSAGVLSGTPTTPGDFAFTTSVKDSAGVVGITLLKITVAPLPLAISTPAPIAAGVVGVAYSQALTTTGGIGTVRWSVAAGVALPKGLALSADGVLSGAPTAVGTFPIAVVATDSNKTTASTTYQLTVAQSGGLDISVGSLEFTAFTFGSNPPPQNIALISTPLTNGVNGFPFQIAFSTRVDAAWLTVTPSSATTPANLEVNVFPRLEVGTYTANITIAGGNAPARTIPVTLKVAPAVASLAVAPSEVRLYGDTKLAAGSLTGSIQLTNTGAGTVAYTANVVDIPGATVSPNSGSVIPNATVPILISVDSRALTTGYYRGRVEVNWATGSASAMVTVQVSAKPKLFFQGSGGTANATEGVGLIGPAARSFTLLSSDSTAVRYAAKVIGSAPWLTLTGSTSGTVTNNAPATISYNVNPSGLSANAYYARIRIMSPDVLNSPTDYLVVLKVNPADVPAPSLFPAGLAFVTPVGITPAVQTFQIYTNSGAPASLQLGVNTLSGGSWLAAKESAATASTTSPATVQVSINPAGLAKGIYRATITVHVGGASARSASVLLVVTAAGSENSPGSTSTVTAGCTPSALAVVQTALEGNFFLLAGFPGVVNTKVLDDCGNAVSNASVAASFSNGDAPLALRIADPAAGVYTQTWVPNHPVAGLITTVTATAAGLASSTEQIGGTAGPNTVPTLRGDGPLHIFYPKQGGSLAPGTILQIYGSGLGNLTGTLVDIGGFNAPLLYAGDAQIDAEVPFELTPGEYQIVAIVNNAITDARTLTVDPVTPGLASFSDGLVIAQHGADYSLITSASPAKPNEFVILYLAGMGPTTPPVATGDKSPLPPAIITPLPTVTLDGKTTQVAFAGLSPGIIAVYQINFVVPSDAATGNLQLQVIQNGVPANTILLPVAR